MAFTDPGAGRDILDSGRGTQPGEVTLAEASKAGDVLGYSSGWKRALATVGTAIQGRVVALRGGASGEKVGVSANPAIGGYSGATPAAMSMSPRALTTVRLLRRRPPPPVTATPSSVSPSPQPR